MNAEIRGFQEKTGYSFNNEQLLIRALTHTSYANEIGRSKNESNERLEFLGDAVLELIISEHIYKTHPDMSEGEMTKLRASVVCEENLSHHARLLHFGDYMLLGKGERATGGAERNSLLADAFEAVLGAVFLDGGIEQARQYALSSLAGDIAENGQTGGKKVDYKTDLQEIMQRSSKEQLIYSVLSETGPDHDKEFVSSVSHSGSVIGTGSGRTKKESEQNAAKMALEALENQ